MAVLLGIMNAQVEMNFSYEMKYGDGKQVKTTGTTQPVPYYYFENLLDVNTYYGDNFYIYTQLEYSDHPVYGSKRTGLDSLINTFYLEYSNDRLNMKLGDIYELYGRGLNFYTMQDQNIDYNNSVRGLFFNYWLINNLGISGLYGKGDYHYRSAPSERETNRQLSTSVIIGSMKYENDVLGFLNYSHTFQNLNLKPKPNQYYGGTEIGDEIEYRALEEIGSYVSNIYLNNKDTPDTVKVLNNNINWNFFVGPIELNFDKSWITYDKIYGDADIGSRFYGSIYTEILETGVTYEYKNYYTPYLLKSVSNPPIVYREGSSVLASRNSHSINFGNEIGHQVDFNKNLFENINILGNLSFSYRHQKDGMAELSIMEFFAMNEDAEIYDYYPFRQMYLEVNGWALSERLYYKIGFDRYTEFNVGAKNTFAITIPTQWVLKFSNGNSLTTYLEAQDKTVKGNIPGDYTNYYLSMSYSNRGKWIVTSFYDQEISKGKTSQWPGFDFSYYLNSTTQISLFYGSQKGGLICANGICAEQPGFEDGFKITIRSLF